MGESYNFPICLSGEIGKHKGLKIPRPEWLCGFKSHLRYYTPIAQLVLEQQTFNLWVLGSNPNGGTYASLV